MALAYVDPGGSSLLVSLVVLLGVLITVGIAVSVALFVVTTIRNGLAQRPRP